MKSSSKKRVKWRTILIPVGILLGAVVVASLLVGARKELPKQEEVSTAMLVDVIEVDQKNVDLRIITQGTVEPRTETSLLSEIRGKIIEVSPQFVAGGFFAPGDLLVQIDPSDYQVQVKSAQAALASRQAQLAQEVARAEQAKKDWEQLQGKRGEASDLVLRRPQLAEAQASVRAAEADLEQAQRDLERTSIRAPYEGMVRTKMADIGQFVSVGAQLGEIFAVDYAEVRLPLSDRDLAFIELPRQADAPGDNNELVQRAYPVAQLSAEIAGRLHQWTAPVVRSEGVIDRSSRVTYVVAQVADPYGLHRQENSLPLRMGSFVEAELDGLTVEAVFAVPRYVIKGTNQLLVMDDDGRLRIREVDVVRAERDFAYVEGGLSVGERVVTTAIETPIEGMALRTRDDSVSPPEAGGSQLAVGNSEGMLP